MVEEARSQGVDVGVSRDKLFQGFIEEWFHREYTKVELQFADAQINNILPKGLNDRDTSIQTYWKYGRELAYQMDKEGLFSFSRYQIKKQKGRRGKKKKQDPSYWDHLFDEQQGYNPMEKSYAFRALLLYKIRGKENAFRFWHRKLQEFFSAAKEGKKFDQPKQHMQALAEPPS